MASELTRSIVRTIRAVPFGKVASYGQIAMVAGHPRGPGGAREVVRILASLSEKENLPWWRIVRKNLSIAFSDPESYALQRQLLEAEGVGFTADGTISRDAQWCGRACEFQDDRFRLPPYPTS
ncbi:MAG: MGMT family protein [Rectinema sp.]|nr:MGMT family protein [Rectinema sp.]